jgi:probable F420-dependent oxidoreductase
VTHPFRFGVITSHASDGPEWRARARRAEALGYSSLLMPDHFQDQWEPVVALAVAAAATERLHVGTLVFDNDYRHPAMLAKSIATLDLATGGRVEFGLGAGWKRSDYDETGMPYDPPRVRIDRMIESLAIMRALWASAEPVHFAGAHYTITGAVGTPRPHSRRGPKVCIGAGGKRMLSFAAREADIVAVNATMTAGALDASVAATASPAAFDEKISWVRAAATAAGRVDEIELQCHCPLVTLTDDRASLLDALAPAFGCPSADAADIPLTMVGTIDEMCEAIVRRRDRWGFTYTIVPDDAMETFAPVVAELAGRS